MPPYYAFSDSLLEGGACARRELRGGEVAEAMPHGWSAYQSK